MAKTSVTDWSDIAGNNLDIDGINLSENMPPSYVNNAMREMMAQIKQWKDGEAGVYQSQTVQNLKVNGNANVVGMLSLNGSQGNTGQVLTSAGAGLPPVWSSGFYSGMIMLWSGSKISTPTGWHICDGTNGTPNLKGRFIVGAGTTYDVNETGGSANATLVSHTHTGTTNTVGNHVHQQTGQTLGPGSGGYAYNSGNGANLVQNTQPAGSHSHTLNISANGSSGTNANLPPYYALCYIMKL